MLIHYAALIAGLAILIVCGDLLVKGAVGLAERFSVPPLIIGLTIVAFGTSAPELFVSLDAALSGKAGLAVGNVVGSNIANVLLVIGLPAIISSMSPTEPGMRRNTLAMLAATAIFMAIMGLQGELSRISGVVLFGLLIVYIVWQFINARRSDGPPALIDEEELNVGEQSGLGIGVRLVVGLVGLPIAASLTVSGASAIALSWGVPETVIGLTIVGIGTSLPELAASVAAAWRSHGAVAFGNVVGSNLFNILSIMGITAMIAPFEVDPRVLDVDMWVMGAVAIVLTALVLCRLKIGKLFGSLMLASYGAYLYVLFAT